MLLYKPEELRKKGNIYVLYTKTRVMSADVILFLYIFHEKFII